MVLFGVVRATGAVMAPLLVLTFSLLVVRFPLAEVLISRYQVDAIWWSFPISSALAATLAVLYYKYGGWRSARMAGGPTRNVVAPEG
jgi:Na+-driven multidrug efflux pump